MLANNHTKYIFSLLQEIINLPIMNMADCDEINEDGTTIDQVTEEPEGIFQLIDKLESIVDHMVPG